MKIIAVTQRLYENEKYYEVRDALDTNWGNLFTKLEIIPIILPSKYDFRIYFDKFKINGLLLTGGNDLGSISGKQVDMDRDAFEYTIIDYCIEHGISIYGVCRGMQIIARYFGVELEQVSNHVATTHKISINPQFIEYGLFSSIKKVNSYHNYRIKNLPNNFSKVAWADDGTIEAMVHNELKIFCQMWHPERDNTGFWVFR